MNDTVFCAGHLNGFEHLTLDMGGLENDYDLGYKFEERESDKFSIDPTTGIKAWAEPLLVLYVSLAHQGSPTSLPTLRYGLTRLKFAGGMTSNHEDRQRLLKIASSRITSDVAALKAGATPEAARDVVML